ncbi:MAG: hypothetical protein R3F41_04445 [Gammaproteobacteria bacterium]|nr:hypothetical protein [Pseudomonadales bacterium]MCP5345456.1 hypothetical protein [Pseudomonadales bacterium]
MILRNLLLLWLLSWAFSAACLAQNAEEIERFADAQQTFKFIARTLRDYDRNGEIDQSLDIEPGARDTFIELLRHYYADFTEAFSPDSNFCRFYQNPRNAIMEIEERAALAFQYLRQPADRVQRYADLASQFGEQVRAELGDTVAAAIERLKTDASSFEYLPGFEMYSAERVNFADTACR